MPYLRIFDGDMYSDEAVLTREKVLIGRNTNIAEVLLTHPSVSRVHAVLTLHNLQYMIEDCNSRAGTFVNGKQIFGQPTYLRHGDTIQCGESVLEYRTDDDRTSELQRAEGVNRALLLAYRRLPGAVKVRYRAFSMAPGEVFETGDTVLVAQGGLMLPEKQPLPIGTVLEVEISSPNGKCKIFPGEVVASIPWEEENGADMCVKLHNPEEHAYNEALYHSKRGSWKDVVPVDTPSEELAE